MVEDQSIRPIGLRTGHECADGQRMTARTTKTARVNPHPARKARQLAGLTSGIVYAGATIGIGVTAAGGSSALDTTVQEGDAATGQEANQVVPDGLGFHLEGGATASSANTPTTPRNKPLVLTAPTAPADSTTTSGAEDVSDTGSTAPTTAVVTTSGAADPRPTTTSSVLATTSTSNAAQPTTTGVTTEPPTTQPTTTQPTTTQPTTTQPTTTQPPTTQPPTTESGAS